MIAANLSTPYFEIVSGPQNLNYLDWVPLIHYYNNMGGFNFYSNLSLDPRSDTGLVNSPPIVLINPVLTIQAQDSAVELVYLYIVDPDEDTIQCGIFLLLLKFFYFLGLFIIVISVFI